MAARADDDGRLEAPSPGDDGHRIGTRLDARDADAPADVGARGGGPLEEVVVELAADDAVAGGTAPSRLVAPAVELDHAGVERLDRQRVLFGGDFEVSKGLIVCLSKELMLSVYYKKALV